ncbi:hypothetical protein N7451_007262 [Penicillium sp. IBT 35674x]|nr:hypothetical protein N7451_007262 [Penicillium sp. IBT 35674x]
MTVTQIPDISLVHLQGKETLIQDIKQNEQLDHSKSSIRDQILEGLNDPLSPSIPSILLWDDIGLKLFETLALTPQYAPFHSELSILNQHVDEIIAIIPSGSLLIELGCGSLHKTSIILSAFERQQREVTYYALDLSRRELVEGLGKLKAIFRHSKYVKLQGLLGSYEDGIGWLSQYATATGDFHDGDESPAAKSKMVTFLWVGNSISNFSPTDAAVLLKGFAQMCKSLDFSCQFLIGVHSCEDEEKVLVSYNSKEPALCDFILHGLDQANLHLGKKVFLKEDWICRCEFNPGDHVLRVYYEAAQEVRMSLGGDDDRIFHRGDRVLAIISGKWTLEDIKEMCGGVGLEVSHSWRSLDNECGELIGIMFSTPIEH